MPQEECTTGIREIPEFLGYGACEDGTIWSRRGPTKQWHRLRGTIGQMGYIQHGLSIDGKLYQRMAHVLVLMAFRGPRPTPKHESRHLDGNRRNNAIGNLEWGTPSENTEDKRRHGTLCVGSRHGISKLTEEQVAEIRTLYAAGGTTHEALSARFNVSTSAIYQILKRMIWQHVA